MFFCSGKYSTLLYLSPPKKKDGISRPFSLVKMRGREALCKPQARKESGTFQRPTGAESGLPSPSEGWGVGSDSPPLPRGDLHHSRTSRTKRFGWFFFMSRSRQNRLHADMLRTDSSQQATRNPDGSQKRPVGILYTYDQFISNITTPSRYEI